MKQYFECHITCRGKPDEVRPHVEAIGWTFSAINDDPDLGPGLKCYATLQLNIRNTEAEVETRLTRAAERLRKSGIMVLREKIERVIYDKRT